MKLFLSVIIASFIIGFVCFAIMYWGFNIAYSDSITTALSVGLAGLIVEYLRPYITKNRKK